MTTANGPAIVRLLMNSLYSVSFRHFSGATLMMRSIRTSCTLAVILVVSQGCGCASDEVAYWPIATRAMIKDRDAPRVLATVPIEQRETIKRRSLAIPNDTPVIVIDDLTTRRLGGIASNDPLVRRPAGFQLFAYPVRVRVTTGVDQGTEVNVRRQDLALPTTPNESRSALVPISLMILMAAAAAFWLIETLALRITERRKGQPDAVTIRSTRRRDRAC